MSIRLIGKNKFKLVRETDGYIHKVYIRFTGSSFHITNDGKEDAIFLRFGKATFLQKLSELNPNNETIYISNEDFEEMRLYLKNSEAYVKSADKFFAEEQLAEVEEEIMNERTSDEDYEAQTKNYNPDFDNFNSDDYDSSYYEAE